MPKALIAAQSVVFVHGNHQELGFQQSLAERKESEKRQRERERQTDRHRGRGTERQKGKWGAA